MKKHLFLQAPVQSGKSTLLQEAMEPYRQYIGGFVSQRLKDEALNTVGFRLADYNEYPKLTAPFCDSLSDIFLKRTADETFFDLSVFENRAIKIIEDTKKDKKLILLDEIGGGELKSEIFRDYLYKLLGENNNCIGVLKIPKAAANTGRGIGTPLEDVNLMLYHKMEEYNTEFMDYNREEFYNQVQYIRRFIESKLNSI